MASCYLTGGYKAKSAETGRLCVTLSPMGVGSFEFPCSAKHIHAEALTAAPYACGSLLRVIASIYKSIRGFLAFSGFAGSAKTSRASECSLFALQATLLPLFAAILRCMSQFAVSSATLWLYTRSFLCSCSLFARGIFARLRLSLSCGFVFRLLFVAIPFFALPKCARLTPRAWLPGKCGAECGRVCIIRENGNNVSCETMENKSRSGGNRASCPCLGTKIGLQSRFWF